MPTILLKRSNTPGAVPGTANLTNLSGGAEVAVNTADKRMFALNSSSAVVELGTNPSSLTCADASLTVARIGSLTVSSLSLTNATITSATVTTLTGTSANITTLTGTTFGTTASTQLRGASAQITTATVTSANITTLSGTNFSATSLTLTNALGRAQGGTGLSSTPSNGQLLIGNGSGYTLATLTAGTNISLTNSTGSITIAATGGLTGITTSNTTALGVGAGTNLTSGTTNTLVGYNAGNSVTTGVSNTAFGYDAAGGAYNTSFNTFVGYQTGRNIQSNGNTGVGNSAVQGVGASATGANNTGVGFWALRNITSGESNTAVGYSALTNNSSGNNNTAVGFSSLTSNTSGVSSTAVGYESLASLSTGNFGTAVGYQAGYSNVSSSSLTAMGYLAGRNTLGNFNTAFGRSALQAAGGATGGQNTAVGAYALEINNSGENNVAVGYTALYKNTSGNDNTGVGYGAGDVTTTGVDNTFVGKWCGIQNVTGSYNTGIGSGAYSGFGQYNNSTCLGYSSAITGSNEVQLGNSSTTTYAYGAVQNRSDARDKSDIEDTDLGLNFVLALRPRKFKWDMRDDYKAARPPRDATQDEIAAWEEANKFSNLVHDGTHKRNRYHQGLIAQEVKATMDAMGVDFGGYQDHKVNGGEDVFSIGYEEMIAPLIKAIQELKAEFDEYKRTHP